MQKKKQTITVCFKITKIDNYFAASAKIFATTASTKKAIAIYLVIRASLESQSLALFLERKVSIPPEIAPTPTP